MLLPLVPRSIEVGRGQRLMSASAMTDSTEKFGKFPMAKDKEDDDDSTWSLLIYGVYDCYFREKILTERMRDM